VHLAGHRQQAADFRFPPMGCSPLFGLPSSFASGGKMITSLVTASVHHHHRHLRSFLATATAAAGGQVDRLELGDRYGSFGQSRIANLFDLTANSPRPRCLARPVAEQPHRMPIADASIRRSHLRLFCCSASRLLLGGGNLNAGNISSCLYTIRRIAKPEFGLRRRPRPCAIASEKTKNPRRQGAGRCASDAGRRHRSPENRRRIYYLIPTSSMSNTSVELGGIGPWPPSP